MAHGGARVTTAMQCAPTLGLGVLRQALTTTLERATFNGQPLRVNPWGADVFNPPCVFLGMVQVQWGDTQYNGLTTVLFDARIVAPFGAQRPNQLDLETLVDVYAGALQEDITLGGAVKRVLLVAATPVVVVHGNQEFPAYQVETRCVL